MYIAKVAVKNYRAFSDSEVLLGPGVTVLIGENNSGKTTLLNALGLVLQRSGRSRPGIDDFCRRIPPSDVPPEIRVSACFRSSDTDTNQDRALVATWLTKPDEPWEARLTYVFGLPQKHNGEFKHLTGEHPTADIFWRAVEALLPKYVGQFLGGEPTALLKAEPEMIGRIDCQILDALRDAESQLLSGRNPLLHRMLVRFLDKKPPDEQTDGATRDLAEEFRQQAGGLVSNVRGRLDLETLFKLVGETGAEDGGTPTLGGRLTEEDLMAALRLMVGRLGVEVPITHNGLGYNNLLYISLVLASLDFETSEEAGDNAVIFPVLAIEEPEAHLHPSMQYKFLKYLTRRLREGKTSRQVFITTHSTHITWVPGP